jgi:photosystem II stability/assembly factor-like uncharacterized protein
VDNDRMLRSEFRQALDEVLPPAPWLESTVADELRKRRSSRSTGRRLVRSQLIRIAVHRRAIQLAAIALAIILVGSVAAEIVAVHHLPGPEVPAKPRQHRAVPYTITPPPAVPSGCSAVPRQWASWPPNAAKMLSTTIGWAFGPMRTADGGATWVDFSPPSIAGRTLKNDEFFLDATHAWVAETATSSSACVDQVVPFRTADGGRTWQQAAPIPVRLAVPTDVIWTGFDNHAQLFDFIDAQNGWLLLGSGPLSTAGGDSSWNGPTWRVGDLFRTTDGGLHWAIAAHDPGSALGCIPNIGFGLSKAAMSFSSPSTGWIVASCGQSLSPQSIDLLVTHDGGSSWTRAATPLAPKEAPVFFDAKHGMTLATGGLMATTDGGLTWSTRSLPDSYGIDFFNRNQGWAVGPGDSPGFQCNDLNQSACNGNFRLYFTRDGGVTWTPGTSTGLVMMGTKWWPPAYLHFIDSANGFVEVGEDPREQGLYRTRDGGRTWTRVDGTVEGP